MSLSIKTSIPGFCNPIALSIPPYVSITRGVGLPSQGTLATPLVTTAPRQFRSTNSEYSIPEPNVPDAVITGFLNSTPAIVTFVFFIRYPPHLPDIRGHPYRFLHSSHGNVRLRFWSSLRSQDRRLHHMPFSLPGKYRLEYSAPVHIS